MQKATASPPKPLVYKSNEAVNPGKTTKKCLLIWQLSEHPTKHEYWRERNCDVQPFDWNCIIVGKKSRIQKKHGFSAIFPDTARLIVYVEEGYSVIQIG